MGDKHINLYLDRRLLGALAQRTDGRGRAGWNRSSVTRAMLRLYLAVVSAPLPELPAGALAVLASLIGPEHYGEQAPDLIPQIVQTHPDLGRVCQAHGVDPAILCESLARLDTQGIVVLLDHLLVLGAQ